MGNGNELLTDARICLRLLDARFRGQAQYRGSFIAQILGNLGANFVEFLAIVILFSHFGAIGGWNIQEVMFLYGLSCITFSLAHFVGSGFAAFSILIHQGTFDRVLVRPVGTLWQVLAADLQLRRLGEGIQGLAVFAAALLLGDVSWTAGKVVYLPVIIASATVVYLALFALEATLCFWTTQATEVLNAFTYGGSDMAQYPLHIFAPWLRNLLFFVVPIGFVIYLPALYLLDKPNPLGWAGVWSFVAPLAAALFGVVALLLWQTGVRHYRSTGT